MNAPAPLRPYQARLVEEARAAYRGGARAILIVLPTGGGKTRVGGEFVLSAVARERRVLWLAHRRELVEQAYRRLRADGLEDVSVIAAPLPHLYRPGAAVQVASLQTLTARGALPEADLVIFDEAHHYVAADWHSFATHYAHAARLGLTATPQRADGTPLGNLFEQLVVGATIHELQDEGFLVPCDVIAPERNLKSDLAQDPVAAWQQHAQGRATVVFCRNVAHGEEVTEAFKAAGARAAFIDGETPAVLRKRALDSFQEGQLAVLVNVYVLTEGWDAPRAEVCMLARSCGSAGTFLQMVGRVLRPAPGKSRALLLDLSGVVHLHGLPDDDREYSLGGDGIQAKKKLPSLRQCPSCGRVTRPTGKVCACGYVWPSPEGPSITGDNLKPWGAIASPEQKAIYLDELQHIARERGYKPGWVGHRFRERFGHFPREGKAA